MSYKILTKTPATSSIVIEVQQGTLKRKIDVRVPKVVTEKRQVETKRLEPGIDGEKDQEVIEILEEDFERDITADDVRDLLDRVALEAETNMLSLGASANPLESVFAEL